MAMTLDGHFDRLANFDHADDSEPEFNPIMRDLAKHTGRLLRKSQQPSDQHNEASASGDKEGEQSTPNYQS